MSFLFLTIYSTSVDEFSIIFPGLSDVAWHVPGWGNHEPQLPSPGRTSSRPSDVGTCDVACLLVVKCLMNNI